MSKVFLATTIAVGLLVALYASADAGSFGRTPGGALTPHGWSQNTTGQSHSGWTTNSQTGMQPPGWSQNTTGQTHGWNSSIVAPGLNSH